MKILKKGKRKISHVARNNIKKHLWWEWYSKEGLNTNSKIQKGAYTKIPANKSKRKLIIKGGLKKCHIEESFSKHRTKMRNCKNYKKQHKQHWEKSTTNIRKE